MSEIKQVEVNASLVVEYIFNRLSLKETVVASDEIDIDILEEQGKDPKPILGERLTFWADIMRAAAARKVGDNSPEYGWTLYFAFDGRCWYLEGDQTSKEPDLGYLDFNSAEGLVAIMENQVCLYEKHPKE